jgi:hypothetical protein
MDVTSADGAICLSSMFTLPVCRRGPARVRDHKYSQCHASKGLIAIFQSEDLLRGAIRGGRHMTNIKTMDKHLISSIQNEDMGEEALKTIAQKKQLSILVN